MTAKIRLILFLISLFWLAGITAVTAQNTTGNNKEIKIKTGFHCANGKAFIEKTLAEEPGVVKVVADLETKIVTIVYDDTKTDKDKLIACLEKMGYRTEFTPEEKKIEHKCNHKHE